MGRQKQDEKIRHLSATKEALVLTLLKMMLTVIGGKNIQTFMEQFFFVLLNTRYKYVQLILIHCLDICIQKLLVNIENVRLNNNNFVSSRMTPQKGLGPLRFTKCISI